MSFFRIDVLRVTLFAAWLGALACRSAQPPSDINRTAEFPSKSAPTSIDATVAPGEASPTTSATSAGGLAKSKMLSTQPFPVGPEDEALCAAIHSTELDLWTRFGHFIPLYWDGVIWVGEGSEQDLKATKAAIATYAPRLLLAEGRTCSRGGVLLYVDDLHDGYSDSLGNEYSIEGLERAAFAANPIVKRTLAQRFVVNGEQGFARLTTICPLNAQQCDAMLRLRAEWPRPGLCNVVVSLAREYFAKSDRPWATTTQARDLNFRLNNDGDVNELYRKCELLSPDVKVCAMNEQESVQCWTKLAQLLGY